MKVENLTVEITKFVKSFCNFLAKPGPLLTECLVEHVQALLLMFGIISKALLRNMIQKEKQ